MQFEFEQCSSSSNQFDFLKHVLVRTSSTSNHVLVRTSSTLDQFDFEPVRVRTSILHGAPQDAGLARQKKTGVRNLKLACALTVYKPCALPGNALLCARLCTTSTRRLHVLGHLSAQEVHKFVCLKCKSTEDVHHLGTQVHKDLKVVLAQGLEGCAGART